MVHGNATAFGNASLAGLPTGSCDANTPCANGACCGKSNFCGYSPRFCGAGCQHNCDAKAECGPYAPADSQTCPLNVCCSAFGFCGSTSEFCTWTSRDDPAYAQCDTRYGGCGSVTRPSCGGSASSSAAARRIGYYESWANTRTCDAVAPEDLNLVGFTHINFAFAFFDGASFQVTSMDANAAALYSRFTALKSKAPGLQAWVSIGGWSLTDPGPTRTAFSAMVGSAGNRATFIAGVSRFLATYGFDGVDLDWEYPVADDRGGTKADKANYAALAREMKAAFAGRYGISMTLPTSYWYLQHFDLPAIAPHVDWFNLMSYDLHGVWDRDSRFVGPYIAPHTNLTEIDLGLDLLWRSGVAPGQVVLGEGWYGRSFTLADSACTQPNGVCRFSGPAEPGPCSAAAGILDRREIDNIIAANHLQPSWDKSAGVKWVSLSVLRPCPPLCPPSNTNPQITWDNQWVSYDDEDTLQQKHDFASSRCLGGTMVWAMDQISQNGTDGSQNGNQNGAAADAQSVCRFASCDSNSAKCPHGSSTVKGAPGSTCPATGHQKEKERPLCCDGGTTLGKCQWRGYRGAGLACMGACLEGETLVATSGDGRSGTGVTRQTCSGGQQMYCCSGFAAAPKNKKKDDKKKKLEDAAEDAAKGVAEAAAAQVAIDILAKAFCRIAVPALLAALEALEALIPIVGEILDLVEIAATPALIMACTKAVEKEGKAELKILGKKHTLSLDRSHEKPPATRPPERSHDKPKTSTRDDGSCAKDGKGTKGGRGGRGGRNRRDEDGHLAPADNCMRHITSYTGHVYETYETRTRICRGDHYPQACMHYESAVYAGGHRFNPLTCDEHVPPRNFVRNPNAATARWAAQHHRGWTEWKRRERRRCQRDEWPPHHFWQGRAGELIRFNHKEDNAGAGQLWNQFCPEFAPHGCRAGSVRVYDPPPYARRPVTTFCEKLVTLQGKPFFFFFVFFLFNTYPQ